jgi:glyoxylase-like metal-dependent hydrolase (beta-lactamase superfamily II)
MDGVGEEPRAREDRMIRTGTPPRPSCAVLTRDVAPCAHLPGRPVAIPTPGHTDGHVALHRPDRDALTTGDALVTRDPCTGRTGCRIVAGAATADSGRALRSLAALEGTDARLVLPGHGAPWTDGIRSAVAAARAVGPS